MIGDRRDPAQLRVLQERALARYVASAVYPYSAFYRTRLDAAGLGRKPSGHELMARLPPTSFADLSDPSELVLRPDEATVQRFGSPSLLVHVFWAKLWRRAERANRDRIEPAFKPVHWHVAAGVPIAYTAEDLDRLAEQGRALLALAELGRYDVVVNVLPNLPDVPFWEIVLGCRAAGVSALHLPSDAGAAAVEAARPNVLAGRPGDLEALLRTLPSTWPELHTILAVGEPLDDRRRNALATLAPDAHVVGAWAPPGVRSLWVECRGGDGAAHTFPDVELVEEVGGEIVWTGIGWKGSALLRFRTGVRGSVETGSCRRCGRTSARVRFMAEEPRFARVLDATPAVVGWQAEIREVEGGQELVVHLTLESDGHPGRVLRALDRELSVAQFVVVTPEELESRLNATGYQRILTST